MDIELDRDDLDKSIEVLSSAARTLRLTRFESLSYRALMLSVDVATVTWVAAIVVGAFLPNWIVRVLAAVGGVSILVGLVSVVLNIPLFVRVFRESSSLKKLGLSSLSRSLWVESRRHRWISRARSYLLVGVGGFLGFAGVALSIAGALSPEARLELLFSGVPLAIIAGLLLAARYLRNQRERIDLTANAEELRNALRGLRERAGNARMVAVPSVILEQTAKIESAQIVKERRDAVLQSAASPKKEYAIAFNGDAVEQRAMLSLADRVELEDLVEQLSAEVESRAGGGTGVAAVLRAATKSKRVEIDYQIDRISRRIYITAVLPGVGGSPAFPGGANNA
jgi:hypothetical protein